MKLKCYRFKKVNCRFDYSTTILRYGHPKKCPTILYGVNLWLRHVSVTGASVSLWRLLIRYVSANTAAQGRFNVSTASHQHEIGIGWAWSCHRVMTRSILNTELSAATSQIHSTHSSTTSTWIYMDKPANCEYKSKQIKIITILSSSWIWKGCICYFAKWQIHPFIFKRTLYTFMIQGICIICGTLL